MIILVNKHNKAESVTVKVFINNFVFDFSYCYFHSFYNKFVKKWTIIADRFKRFEDHTWKYTVYKKQKYNHLKNKNVFIKLKKNYKKIPKQFLENINFYKQNCNCNSYTFWALNLF